MEHFMNITPQHQIITDGLKANVAPVAPVALSGLDERTIQERIDAAVSKANEEWQAHLDKTVDAIVKVFSKNLNKLDQQWQKRFDDLEQIIVKSTESATQCDTATLPPLKEITKIKVQFFNNRLNPGEDWVPEWGLYHMKFEVFTTVKGKPRRIKTGVNMYDPTNRQIRSRHKEKLNRLDARNAKYFGANSEIGVVFEKDNRVILHLQGEQFDIGTGKGDKLELTPGESVRSWTWEPLA